MATIEDFTDIEDVEGMDEIEWNDDGEVTGGELFITGIDANDNDIEITIDAEEALDNEMFAKWANDWWESAAMDAYADAYTRRAEDGFRDA
ncbi:hypothetical protein N9917_00125 [Deltaproteobacteria bacterium]|nr:hypothetical protein [Deltaproteobacteria bacterium]